MKMKILVIDDKQDEQNKAIEAVQAAGHEAVSIPGTFDRKESWDALSGFDAVITDLYFDPSNYGWESHKTYQQTPPPMGLVVAAHCVFKGIPCVICTDSFHHGAEASFIFDSYVAKRFMGLEEDRDIAFGWVEYKKWDEAVKLIEQGVKIKDRLKTEA